LKKCPRKTLAFKMKSPFGIHIKEERHRACLSPPWMRLTTPGNPLAYSIPILTASPQGTPKCLQKHTAPENTSTEGAVTSLD